MCKEQIWSHSVLTTGPKERVDVQEMQRMTMPRVLFLLIEVRFKKTVCQSHESAQESLNFLVFHSSDMLPNLTCSWERHREVE